MFDSDLEVNTLEDQLRREQVKQEKKLLNVQEDSQHKVQKMEEDLKFLMVKTIKLQELALMSGSDKARRSEDEGKAQNPVSHPLNPTAFPTTPPSTKLVQKQRKTKAEGPMPLEAAFRSAAEAQPKRAGPCQLYLCLENNSSGSHMSSGQPEKDMDTL
ncbi:unnamed protein product [Pleuronectes platessa]|uniref:Uncharacterized protein n=1 Tax=Pleuronectes platessa TaxID=8262 RepID=A0A9N7VDP9_PLEPL|nr:unnamed protein product [Pleuronectes platessa]